MGTPYLGEIKLISWNFAPKGWAFCNGQLLPINQNQALFSILGTTYGGNGQTNFALPNLQGRVPVHMGLDVSLGESGGEINHTITLAEMAAHVHPINAVNTAPNQTSPSAGYLSTLSSDNVYSPPGNAVGGLIGTSTVGGSQPHNNLQPYLVLNFVIALVGIFPSRN
jgi:microcystin-dependent protein